MCCIGDEIMLRSIARKLTVGLVLTAIMAPAAFADSPIGTDPEPRVVNAILVFLGLA